MLRAQPPTIADRYEGVTFEQVHYWLLSALPDRPGLVLDVGAGTGRDAAWLAAHGNEVVAVEPSAAMRTKGQARHPDPRIRWIPDRLPGLEQTFRIGLSFDFVLLSAVWMHVPPADRSRAFRKVITLLKPGGLLAITLRNGPADEGRGMYPVSRPSAPGLNHGIICIPMAGVRESPFNRRVRKHLYTHPSRFHRLLAKSLPDEMV